MRSHGIADDIGGRSSPARAGERDEVARQIAEPIKAGIAGFPAAPVSAQIWGYDVLAGPKPCSNSVGSPRPASRKDSRTISFPVP